MSFLSSHTDSSGRFDVPLSLVAAALRRHPGWFNLIRNLSSRAPRTGFSPPALWGAPVRADRDLSASLVVSRPSNFASRAGCCPRPVEPFKSAPEARKNLAPRVSAGYAATHEWSAVGAALYADGPDYTPITILGAPSLRFWFMQGWVLGSLSLGAPTPFSACGCGFFVVFRGAELKLRHLTLIRIGL